ncbi:helix-turn-helix domain-containing protein [Methylobacterium dankookense]|nr:transcriptional regulator [Methylobacterium dankookense]
MSLNELRTRASTVDRAKVDATTEADIEAQRAADGDADLAVPNAARVVEAPRALRVRLAMTQREIADALRIPLGTWRNWEQGRVALEPAAAALIAIVSRMPELAFDALAHPEPEKRQDDFLDAFRKPKPSNEVEASVTDAVEALAAALGAAVVDADKPAKQRA